VTDGEQRAALAVVRSLGEAGHRVFVCSARARSLAGASRFCDGERRVPDALREPDAYVTAVRALCDELEVDTLIPISEPSLLAVLSAEEAWDGVLLPFAGRTEFERICDKALVMETARSLGIGVPRQWKLEAPVDRTALAAETLGYPLVLKPARSVIDAAGARAKSSVAHVADAGALEGALEAQPPGAYPILLQERIVGPGIGVFLLIWDGEVRASFFHRRLREKPPSGGVSVFRESAAPDEALLERSVALLSAFGWRGVAMVEYKVDEATGTPYLMEINGRFWGSLQLAIDAGVDFPALLVEVADGKAGPPVHSYRVGVRSRWWWGDVDQLLLRLRRSAEELSLPPGAQGRARAVLEFLRASGRGSRNEVLRWSDPSPAWRETLDWFRRR
jgi:predicted ATP-grasp superfamily ATP-dependent carboligase